jgi:hypothetical protein
VTLGARARAGAIDGKRVALSDLRRDVRRVARGAARSAHGRVVERSGRDPTASHPIVDALIRRPTRPDPAGTPEEDRMRNRAW